jgi:hypothetical protein
MNSKPDHLRDIEPAETTVGGDELEVVEVDVHVDGLVPSEIHVIVVVRDFLVGRDEAGGIDIEWNSWSMTRKVQKGEGSDWVRIGKKSMHFSTR